MASTRTIAAVLLLAACVATTVQGDCGEVLQGLLSSPTCAAKSGPTFTNAPKAAAGDCKGAEAGIGGFDAACCPGLRALVTSGCVCDPTFLATLMSLGGIPDMASAKAVATGTSALVQGGSCASAANGGPVSDPCGVKSCPISA